MISHDPAFFKGGTFAQGRPIDLCCQLAVKAFSLGEDKADEMEALCAVGLLNAILENVP